MTPRVRPQRRSRAAAGVAVLAVVMAAGCGAGSAPTSGRASPGGEMGTSQEASVDISSTPATEQPSVEGTGGSVHEVSIRVPILIPGGGGPGQADPRYQCQPLSWYGYSGVADVPIPDDVVIRFTGISLDPPGVFVVGGDVEACAAGPLSDPCTTSTRLTARDHGCYMVVTQVAEADPGIRVRVHVSATATCVRRESCRVVRDLGASTAGEPMVFSPVPGAVSGQSGGTSGEPGSPSAGGESPESPGTSPNTGSSTTGG